jgi:hypothetical protein
LAIRRRAVDASVAEIAAHDQISAAPRLELSTAAAEHLTDRVINEARGA